CPKLSGQSDALQTKLTVSRCQLKVTRELVQTLTQLVHAWAASFAQQQSEQQQQQQPNRQPQPPLLAFRRPAILLHASLQEASYASLGALSLHMLHAKTGPHGRLKLICSDPIEAFWSPGVHLCLKDIHEHCLAPILKLMHPAEISEAGRHDDASKPSSGPARALLIVNLQQQVSLTLQLSSSHGLNLCLSSLQLESGIARCETASLYFDSRRIFQAVALTVSASTHRQPRVGLNVPENKVYTTAMDTLLVRFPFEFDFYECMDHVLSTRKWLRSVHNHTDKDLIEDDSVPLGPDICVNIGAMARRAGHLDRDKLAQISEQLHARKADTFIKRKMKLRECPASQTLMTWSVSRLSVAWLLDTSLRGRGRLLQAMSSIDPWSPLPPGHEFGTLYGRRLLWWPRARPSPNSIRFVTVEPGSPWPNATVIRCMPPLKFFHDARMRLQLAELCYGSNWQPAFDWFNQCFNNILRPTRDPSPPMPWWDKCRLKYHGTLVAEAKEMVWRYHTSGDPLQLYGVSRTAMPDPVAESNCYTNALKFFDKLATCLTKVSRPIRRGQIFRQNVGGRGGAGVGGRKPLFGRSLRSFRLNLACPRTLSDAGRGPSGPPSSLTVKIRGQRHAEAAAEWTAGCKLLELSAVDYNRSGSGQARGPAFQPSTQRTPERRTIREADRLPG
uniref:Fmp27_GFWDK domain-containing protein n=1 Tax=Macrostomum lignano TaxID=282301 RepID=A0A1I8FG89_9PLAT